MQKGHVMSKQELKRFMEFIQGNEECQQHVKSSAMPGVLVKFAHKHGFSLRADDLLAGKQSYDNRNGSWSAVG